MLVRASGLHKLWYPVVRDMSTWRKFGAHGEHGYVFLFSNLGALWFSGNLIRYSLQGKSRTIFFPSDTLIYGISCGCCRNFNIRTCEHMILGQLRIRTHQTENAPLYTGIKVAYWGTHSILDLFLEPCKIDGNMAVKATFGAEDLWLHAINMLLCNGPRSISRLIPVKSSSYHTLDYSSKK